MTFLPYPNGKRLMLPRSICSQCEAIPFFLIDEEEISPLLQLTTNLDEKKLAMTTLFTSAQNKRNQQLNQLSTAQKLDDDFQQAILNHSNQQDATTTGAALLSGELVDAAQMVKQQSQQHVANINGASNNAHETTAMMPAQFLDAAISTTTEKKPSSSSRMGKLKDVIKALAIKNIQLQSYQRLSTCCVLFTMILLIVAVVILGLIWTSASTCPQGNILLAF